MFRSTFTMLSICMSIGPGLRSSALPSTQRTIFEPTIFADAIIRVSCSSAVPSFASNIFEVGQIDFIPISTSIPCSRRIFAHLTQVVRLEITDEPDLREMHHLRFLGRAVIEILKRRPALRTDTEQVDPQLYGGTPLCEAAERRPASAITSRRVIYKILPILT